MKATRALLLLIIALPLAAQENVTVRLYWHREPKSVTVEPIGPATLRACAECKEIPLTTPRHLDASQNAHVFVGGTFSLRIPDAPLAEVSGTAEIVAKSSGVEMTASVPREAYVAAVLEGETGADAPEEFLRAMAVAVRTYAFRSGRRHMQEHFDFCDTTHCQVARFTHAVTRIHDVVQATAGEMVWSAGHPALTYYHQDCGGVTAAEGEMWPAQQRAPYLSSHADPYCVRANGVQWHSRIEKTAIGSALRASGVTVLNGRAAVVERSASGRAAVLSLGGARVSATSFRFAIGRAMGWDLVRSDFYDLRDTGDAVELMGRGSGHGVGLCQDGAIEMAREGKSYHDILAFYYPGTSIGRGARDIEWKKVAGDGVTLWTTDPQREGFLVNRAQTTMKHWPSVTGLRFTAPVIVKVYPDVAAFRDATGAPGWTAAFTEGNVVHLQSALLFRKGAQGDSALQHELLHVLIEQNTTRALPLWFREGLTEYLSHAEDAPTTTATPQAVEVALESAYGKGATAAQQRQAHADARALVAAAVERYGRDVVVLSWLRNGIPRDVSFDQRH